MDTEMQINPFRVGRPIQDPVDFAGRREIIQKLSAAMRNLQNISMRGERRTGKTSILLYLVHPDTSLSIRLPETHIPVYFDFQDSVEASAVNVWRDLTEVIAEQIKLRTLGGEIRSKKFLSILKEFLTSSEKTSDMFVTGFVRALADLDNSGFKIHLLLDEFDQTVRNHNLGDPFYDTLRSLTTRAENISYVIATRTGLANLQPTTNKVSSPFFNIFTNITLSSFQEDEVYRLIFSYFAQANIDISLAEKLCNESAFLYDVTGYHPFFLQTLCYHLCTKLDEPDWPLGKAGLKAVQAFEKDVENHFQFYWEISSQAERELIKGLATGHAMSWQQLKAMGPIEELKDRCLVVQVNESNHKWRLFSSAFNSWLNRHLELENLQRPQSDLRILVMDDEENQAEPLRMLLENYGFYTEKETNPLNVWQRVRQETYDIIFLDIMMPRFNYDGIGVLVDIKTFSPKSRVIAMTGHAGGQQIAEVMRLGASDFIEKSPHVPSELYLHKVRTVTEQPSLLNEVALREVLIQRLWKRVQHGQNELKGQNLAGLIKLIFESIDGFDRPDIQFGDGEEISIQFENQRSDAFWKDHGGLLQIECLNWSGNGIGLDEYRNFQAKLTHVQLGFLIGYNGFSDELLQTFSDEGNKTSLIVLIDRTELEALIKAEDRENLLRSFVRQAIRGRP